jgi:hypothetical protein
VGSTGGAETRKYTRRVRLRRRQEGAAVVVAAGGGFPRLLGRGRRCYLERRGWRSFSGVLSGEGAVRGRLQESRTSVTLLLQGVGASAPVPRCLSD